MKLPRLRKIHLAVLVVALLALMPLAQASAASITYNLNAGAGGATSFDAFGNLLGVNIPILGIQAEGGVFHPIIDGKLNFNTTGTFVGSTWTFNPGNFSITGAVPDFGIGAGSTILSGTFQGGASIIPPGPLLFENLAFEGNFHNHIQTWDFTGSLTFTFTADINLGTGVFTSTSSPMGGALAHGVPLPPSAILLGFGLFGLVGLRLREPSRD